MSFLELQNITKIYPNGTKAVNETSLNIENGEFAALALVKGPITFQNVSMNGGYLMKRKKKEI